MCAEMDLPNDFTPINSTFVDKTSHWGALLTLSDSFLFFKNLISQLIAEIWESVKKTKYIEQANKHFSLRIITCLDVMYYY